MSANVFFSTPYNPICIAMILPAVLKRHREPLPYLRINCTHVVPELGVADKRLHRLQNGCNGVARLHVVRCNYCLFPLQHVSACGSWGCTCQGAARCFQQCWVLCFWHVSLEIFSAISIPGVGNWRWVRPPNPSSCCEDLHERERKQLQTARCRRLRAE